MSADAEHLFILRLPEPEVSRVKEATRRDELGEMLQLEFKKGMRHATVNVDGTTLSAKLVDLPTVVECHKTIDSKTLYKTGNISQVLVCSHDPLETAAASNVEELPTSQQKEYLKKFTFNHGLTPPLKNVRRRRFKKMTTKKFVDSPEVEKEVKRLLREDLNAVNVVTDDDKANEDTQSVASDGASRAVTPAANLDEDSFSSTTPPIRPYHGNSHHDEKQALMQLLEEVSSSSGGEEEEEEEDEEEDEEEGEEDEEIEVMETEQMRQVSSAIQDLDNQIEEQKLKIQNTPNTNLRGRFEVFLKELEAERQLKMEELEKLEENT